MWRFEHTVESNASPADVYQCYEDPALRMTWDTGIVELALDGPFAAGTNGVMVIEGQGPIPFVIVVAEPARLFVDETQFPDLGLTLRFDHELTAIDGGGTSITHALTITGPSAEQMGDQVGAMVTADFPDAMDRLARLAEERS